MSLITLQGQKYVENYLGAALGCGAITCPPKMLVLGLGRCKYGRKAACANLRHQVGMKKVLSFVNPVALRISRLLMLTIF